MNLRKGSFAFSESNILVALGITLRWYPDFRFISFQLIGMEDQKGYRNIWLQMRKKERLSLLQICLESVSSEETSVLVVGCQRLHSYQRSTGWHVRPCTRAFCYCGQRGC